MGFHRQFQIKYSGEGFERYLKGVGTFARAEEEGTGGAAGAEGGKGVEGGEGSQRNRTDAAG